MKPFSINTKGHFILLKEKENKAYVYEESSKEANIKAISRRTTVTSGTTQTTNQRMQITEGMESLCFHPLRCNTQGGRGWGLCKSLWWMLFSETTWRERNDATAVLFTICTFSWNTDKEVLQAKEEQKPQQKELASIQKQITQMSK